MKYEVNIYKYMYVYMDVCIYIQFFDFAKAFGIVI